MPVASKDDLGRGRALAHRLKTSESIRDIGPPPAVADAARRSTCEASLSAFLTTYFPAAFPLRFSRDHEEVIEALEKVTRRGGQYAMALPRGSGKTTIVVRAALWAILTGRRRYVAVVSSTDHAAKKIVKSMRTELTWNDLLYADFPRELHGIPQLQGDNRRAGGQLCEGEKTEILMGVTELIFPTIAGSRVSGSVVSACGLTGNVRGQFHATKSGEILRPDLAILDDPQTKEALDVDTMIPTPRGFVRMGDINVGDVVFSEDGSQCRVTATSPVYDSRRCYAVTFDDGGVVVCDAGHLWDTSTALQRTNARRRRSPNAAYHSRPQCSPQPLVSTCSTESLASSVTAASDGRLNHSVEIARPIQCEPTVLPIPPYTLGVWLGDGDCRCGRITTADPEVLELLKNDGFAVGSGCRKPNSAAAAYTAKGLSRLLRAAGLLGNKHLPDAYWFATEADRLAVLQGLMDTDGCASSGTKGVKGTRCIFYNTNRRIIDAVLHLCWSLGIKARETEDSQYHKKPNAAKGWYVTFITTRPVFRLSRKLAKLPKCVRPDAKRRYIASIEAVESRPVRCIAVDSPSRLYLCTHRMIPTHNSAGSLQQTQDRLEIVEGDVLGMAGPGKEIAAVMPCTVIEEDDLADRVLKMPLWRGKRAKMIVSFPSNLDWWENYFRVRDGDRDEAQALYLTERETADAGACVAWEERRATSDVSALQTAMHLWHQSPAAFAAEYQNEPRPKTQVDVELMKAADIAAKLNNVPRGIVPAELETLTAFIDVQDHALFWLVAAWGKGFAGAIVDYGAWPDQSRDYWAYSDIRRKLGDVYPGRGTTGAIYAGLGALINNLTGRAWERAGGGVVRLARVLIDTGHETDTVFLACRQHPMAALLLPSKGWGVTAVRTPMSTWAEKKDKHGKEVKRGHEWIISRGAGRGIPHGLYDTNFWKSFVQARLSTPIGDSGSLALNGTDAASHRLLADHLTAEYRTATSGHGRDVWEWKIRPDRSDNHWLDCLVGAAVAASIEGAALPEWGEREKTRKRVEIPKSARPA